MSILIITYSLKNKLDYAPFYDAIKTNAGAWWHYMDSTFIVDTYHSASGFAKFLYPHMDSKDRLLIVKLAKDYEGWLPQEAWDWLNNRLFF